MSLEISMLAYLRRTREEGRLWDVRSSEGIRIEPRGRGFLLEVAKQLKGLIGQSKIWGGSRFLTRDGYITREKTRKRGSRSRPGKPLTSPHFSAGKAEVILCNSSRGGPNTMRRDEKTSLQSL